MELHSWNEWDSATEQSKLLVDIEVTNYTGGEYVQFGFATDENAGEAVRSDGKVWDVAYAKAHLAPTIT